MANSRDVLSDYRTPLAPSYLATLAVWEALTLEEKLARVRVLYCAPYSLAIYGIPYEMRPGQAPKDIHERYRGDWLYLDSGDPLADAFLAKHESDLPGYPHEWVTLPVLPVDAG